MAALAVALLIVVDAAAQAWPAALPLVPGSAPAPLSFYFLGNGGPLARGMSRTDRWYAVSALPVAQGAAYTVLLCCGAAVNGMNLYALDAPPPQAPGMKLLLDLSRVQLAVDAEGTVAVGAMAAFQLPVNAALPQLFLLAESPPATRADETPTLSVEVYGMNPGFPMQRVRGGWWFAAGALPGAGAPGGLSRGRPQMLPVPVARPDLGW